MQTLVVTYIKRKEEKGPISHLGGESGDRDWRHTSLRVKQNIEEGETKYQVGSLSGPEVVVVDSKGGRWYLRSDPDHSTTNNLSDLPSR